MKAMLKKEFSLAMHPAAPIFPFLAAMLLIPGYPFYVAFFYVTLGIFFICLTARENSDELFTLLLPVSRLRAVQGRILTAVILELFQIVLGVIFVLLRGALKIGPNAAGMDAGAALFGLVFVMFGMFNLIFFVPYYKNTAKPGRAFLISAVVTFIYIALMEIFCHTLPFFRDVLDTPAGKFTGAKLSVLVIGAVIYALLTLISVVWSAKNYEKLDIK